MTSTHPNLVISVYQRKCKMTNTEPFDREWVVNAFDEGVGGKIFDRPKPGAPRFGQDEQAARDFAAVLEEMN